MENYLKEYIDAYLIKTQNSQRAAEVWRQFHLYTRLLQEWNERINLTAITETEEIAIKHYLDSLYVTGAKAWRPDLRLADVGSGAGFPGLPLKLLEPGLELCLLDSSEKRVNFLKLVIDKLTLKKTQALNLRAEEAGRREELRENFDFVVSRAVATLPLLLEYCLPLVKPGGYFAAYKGPGFQEELTEAKKALQILQGKLQEIVEAELPEGRGQRAILIFQKIAPVSGKYPRRSGVPAKQPLR